jgi:SAM-dependent methyltransferase
MERIVYDRMAEIDQLHWWYRARRDILSDLIRRKIALPAGARILEVGCGTGHNLDMLKAFGRVDAIEVDPAARAIAAARLGHDVLDAPLPALTGVPDAAYDLIAILDVIEHIDEDRAGLESLARKLKPGGRILITVPAFPWMWSAHDVVNHHKRRYTRKTLRALVADAGLRLDMMSWFNSLLFPLAAASRLAGRLTGKTDSDDTLPPRPVNALFEWIFGLERYALGRLPLPPGVSLVAIVSAS